jgi:hypothetical protein
MSRFSELCLAAVQMAIRNGGARPAVALPELLGARGQGLISAVMRWTTPSTLSSARRKIRLPRLL